MPLLFLCGLRAFAQGEALRRKRAANGRPYGRAIDFMLDNGPGI